MRLSFLPDLRGNEEWRRNTCSSKVKTSHQNGKVRKILVTLIFFFSCMKVLCTETELLQENTVRYRNWTVKKGRSTCLYIQEMCPYSLLVYHIRHLSALCNFSLKVRFAQIHSLAQLYSGFLHMGFLRSACNEFLMGRYFP